jgi:hypothetical protein
MTQDLLALVDWLQEAGVTHVAEEKLTQVPATLYIISLVRIKEWGYPTRYPLFLQVVADQAVAPPHEPVPKFSTRESLKG